MPMNAVKDLSAYRAVVAGSAIRGSKWLPEAIQFIQTHQSTLNQRPFAMFTVCITLAMKNAENYRPGTDRIPITVITVRENTQGNREPQHQCIPIEGQFLEIQYPGKETFI